MKFETIILVFGFLTILYFKFIKKDNSPVTNNSSASSNNVNYSSTEGKLFNKFYSLAVEIISNFNLEIDEAMILSVIEKESYLQSLTKSNKDIIGDDGHSLGCMQVSNPAIIDVNNKYGTHYNLNSILDEKINVTVGSLFLNICFVSAKKSNSKNPQWLAFKKYNGGNDETDNSINSMANLYANQAYDYYKKFKEFT